MMNPSIWLIKLVLSHLISDFLLQPGAWVADRKLKHFASWKLYLHGLITGGLVWLFLGCQYPAIAVVILVTHILIDGWKSYRKESVFYFLLDQGFHLAVIVGCWFYFFSGAARSLSLIRLLEPDRHFWLTLTAGVFLTTPAGILIGKLTSQWRDKIDGAETLANAGKWIGMTERLIVLALVMQHQYAAIGLLVTAKGIIRFNEKDRQEVKTEYLVIGTLLSIGTAMAAGLLAQL